MTIQEKVRNMHISMAVKRDKTRDDRQRRCFELLHDAVVNTGPRIDELEAAALDEYIELAANVEKDVKPNSQTLRNRLIQLGFNTTPVN